MARYGGRKQVRSELPVYLSVSLLQQSAITVKLDPLSLRLFVRVVEDGTIASVAVREHIASAAISRRLSELEDALGTQLLVRTNKGIKPTSAGISLTVMARDLLDDLQNIVTRMQEHSAGHRGLVRLLINISTVSTFIPPLVKSFLDRYPDVQLRLMERDSLSITEGVAENLADIGIFTSLPHSADIEVYPFRRDELKVLVRSDHPLAERLSVTFAEALDFEHVVLRTGTHLRLQMLTAAGQAGKSLRSKVEVTSYDALCKMVECGVGICVLPAGIVDIYTLSNMRTLSLDEPWASRELSVCVRRLDALLPAARLFFDHLRANC
ncbi:LysR family transcriptional regulator [Caballeronia udeis]|uniref:LysR family transcriptional regulator n=1 Tax=Caballeronia udeis TaxID=1232866 RepID=A0A158JVT1_9BURK|nr:LysR family transcriptional regulator [Caballeronia udeis]